MDFSRLCFIGGGNMATALIAGLRQQGIAAEHIQVCDPNTEKLSFLASHYGVKTFTDNTQAVPHAQVVILAVKPQLLKSVCQEIAPHLSGETLILSIAAGITTHSIEQWLGSSHAIVRAMPNTPALIQAGASGLYANRFTSDRKRQEAESLLRAVGICVWVETETELDAVTALSGSGPAYVFYLMEAMQAAGESMGLTAKTAQLLTLQTLYGASKLALESSDSPSQLREKVTSPNGTTQKALETFNHLKVGQHLQEGICQAQNRASQLALELGETS